MNNKEKLKVYNKKYREDNKEKLKKYSREYYIKNKKQILIKYKKHSQKPKVKAKRKEYYKKYNQEHKEYHKEYYQNNKEYHKEYYFNNKEKIKKNRKEYSLTQEAKEKRNKNHNQRRKEDNHFKILINLRCLLKHTFNTYSTTGKIKSSIKYGIDFNKIIESLKPFPEPICEYHIDHIIPLSRFDFNNPKYIKIAFAPENHQWLTIKENISKGNKLIMPH